MSTEFIYQAKLVKIRESNVFLKKKRHRLRTFITQCELYEEFNLLQYNFDKKKMQ